MYKQLMSSTVYGNEDYSFDVMDKIHYVAFYAFTDALLVQNKE